MKEKLEKSILSTIQKILNDDIENSKKISDISNTLSNFYIIWKEKYAAKKR